MRKYINSFLRFILDFFSKKHEIIIHSGTGAIIDNKMSIVYIEWIDTKIRIKKDEIVIIGKDLTIRTCKVKDLLSIQQSNIILYRPEYYHNERKTK